MSKDPELPFAKLERCIHEPARLAILSLLINAEERISYSELRDQLDLTYGNLERHMKVLIEAGMVEVEKLSTSGRSKSFARFSESGRADFLEYLDNLEKILLTAQGKQRTSSDPRPGIIGNYSPELNH